MKKIKLTILAGALILSAIGGYANFKMKNQHYYVVANTPIYMEYYEIAFEEPSGYCSYITGWNSVCIIIAENGHVAGDKIHSSQCMVVGTYPYP